MCRMDFLPRLVHSDPDINGINDEKCDLPNSLMKLEWVFSEMEGHWCEGFFRAAPDVVFDDFTNSVRRKRENCN